MAKYIFILFIFSSINSFCQSLEERQADVFTQIEHIDKLKKLKLISLENETFLDQLTDGGAELKGYFDNDELVKILAKAYLSDGIETNEYYFKSNQLFYVRETFERYEYIDSLGTFKPEKTEVSFIGEYVFKNKLLIDLESLGHSNIEATEVDIEKMIISEMMRYQAMIRIAKKEQ